MNSGDDLFTFPPYLWARILFRFTTFSQPLRKLVLFRRTSFFFPVSRTIGPESSSRLDERWICLVNSRWRAVKAEIKIHFFNNEKATSHSLVTSAISDTTSKSCRKLLLTVTNTFDFLYENRHTVASITSVIIPHEAFTINGK